MQRIRYILPHHHALVRLARNLDPEPRSDRKEKVYDRPHELHMDRFNEKVQAYVDHGTIPFNIIQSSMAPISQIKDQHSIQTAIKVYLDSVVYQAKIENSTYFHASRRTSIIGLRNKIEETIQGLDRIIKPEERYDRLLQACEEIPSRTIRDGVRRVLKGLKYNETISNSAVETLVRHLQLDKKYDGALDAIEAKVKKLLESY